MFKRGLIGYLPANLIQGGIGFLTLIVFTRVLSPEAYGHYALAFGVTSFVHTLGFTWLEAAMARFWAGASRDPDASKVLYGTLYRAFAALAVAFAVLSTLALWLIPLSAELKLAVGAGLASVVLRVLLKLVQEQRRAAGRVLPASMIDSILTLAGFGFGVGLALAGLGGSAPLLGVLLGCAICLPFVLKEDLKFAAAGRFDAGALRTYAAYGFPIAGSLILTLGLYTLDRFLIAGFLDAASVGAYHAGYSLASRSLDVVFLWIGAAGGPALVAALEQDGPDGLKQAARTQFETMLFLTAPGAVGLMLVSGPLCDLMLGPDLREAAKSVTPLIVLGAFASGLTTYYFHQAFTLAQKTRILMVAMALPALANLGLNLLLIPMLGLPGAALATSLSFLIGLIASLWLGRRYAIALPLCPMAVLKTALACAVMAGFVVLLPAWGGWAELLLKGLCGGLIYAFMTLWLDLNGLRSNGLQLVKDFRAKRAL